MQLLPLLPHSEPTQLLLAHGNLDITQSYNKYLGKVTFGNLKLGTEKCLIQHETFRIMLTKKKLKTHTFLTAKLKLSTI